MKPRLILCAVGASSIALLAACGGAKESELFASPSSDLGTDTNGTVPPGAGSGTEPSASSSGGSSSTSSGGSTSSSGGSSTSSGGSTSSSGGSSSSSGGSTSSSGGSTSSSGGTSSSSGIWCGEDKNGDDVYCASGSTCCAKDGGGYPALTCQSNGGSCQGGLAIKCDDQTDCPVAHVCCGQFDENFGYKSVSCSAACINVGSTRAVRFCDQNAANDECAAIGKTCQWSGSLPGYSVCK